jgi:hypothetical protein
MLELLFTLMPKTPLPEIVYGPVTTRDEEAST